MQIGCLLCGSGWQSVAFVTAPILLHGFCKWRRMIKCTSQKNPFGIFHQRYKRSSSAFIFQKCAMTFSLSFSILFCHLGVVSEIDVIGENCVGKVIRECLTISVSRAIEHFIFRSHAKLVFPVQLLLSRSLIFSIRK